MICLECKKNIINKINESFSIMFYVDCEEHQNDDELLKNKDFIEFYKNSKDILKSYNQWFNNITIEKVKLKNKGINDETVTKIRTPKKLKSSVIK